MTKNVQNLPFGFSPLTVKKQAQSCRDRKYSMETVTAISCVTQYTQGKINYTAHAKSTSNANNGLIF